MTREQLLSKTGHSLRMKDLREFVENNKEMNDNAPVIVERVTDDYFQERPWHDGTTIGGWNVLKVEGYQYHSAIFHNESMYKEVDRRKQGLEPEYRLENPLDYIFGEKQLEEMKEQFYQPHCITTEPSKEIVYIYSHY